jgi:hypothetical protein
MFHLFSDQNLFTSKQTGRNTGSYEVWDYYPATKIVCQRPCRKNFLNSPQAKEWVKFNVYQFNQVTTPNRMKVDDDTLFVSRTIATGGISLAWKMGARRIFLLGVDGYKIRRGAEEVYYHDGTAKPKERRKERTIKQKDRTLVIQDRHDAWAKNMNELKKHFVSIGNPYPSAWPGPGIYNLSPLSTINAWPKVDREVALEESI